MARYILTVLWSIMRSRVDKDDPEERADYQSRGRIDNFSPMLLEEIS